MITAESAPGPTTELLQSLIRNQCVNDGTPDSGEEVRNADLLQAYLEGGGLDVARRAGAVPDGAHRRRAREP